MSTSYKLKNTHWETGKYPLGIINLYDFIGSIMCILPTTNYKLIKNNNYRIYRVPRAKSEPAISEASDILYDIWHFQIPRAHTEIIAFPVIVLEKVKNEKNLQ